MKKINWIVFFVLLVFAAFFESCATTSFGELYVSDDIVKYAENPSKLKPNDFKNTDFFMENVPNDFVGDFNVAIFKKVKEEFAIAREEGILGSVAAQISDAIEKNGEDEYLNYVLHMQNDVKSGEFVDVLRHGNIGIATRYFVYNEKLKDFEYNVSIFTLYEDKYKKALEQYGNLQNQIENYEWTIENCSSPTILKSRWVQVPYKVTERQWVNGFWHADGGVPGHWEEKERIVYQNVIENYTEPNPNYNPSAVNEAQKKLPIAKNNLKELKDALKTVPAQLTIEDNYWALHSF